MASRPSSSVASGSSTWPAWAEHLALYPVPPSPPDDPGLVSNLEPYVKGKGTLHFPYAAGLPTAVLERVLRAHLIRAGQWPA